MDQQAPGHPEMDGLLRLALLTALIGAIGVLVFGAVAALKPGFFDALWLACMAISMTALIGGLGLYRRKNWGRVLLMATNIAILGILGVLVMSFCRPRMINDPLDETMGISMVFGLIYAGIKHFNVLWRAGSLML